MKMKRNRFSPNAIVLLALGILATPVAHAQEQNTPVLPNLAPREVEIRGQLVIQFPALERQPLIGFNPPPRIPVVPATRRPLVEDYKQGRADLPQSAIDRPDAPGALMPGAEFLRGEVEAAGGSYFNRLVRGRFSANVSRSISAGARIDYFGTDGSLIGVSDAAEIRNPSDWFDGSLALRSTGESIFWGAELSGFNNSYTVFGLRTDTDSLSGVSPARRVGGGGLQLSVGTTGEQRFESQTEILVSTASAKTDSNVDTVASATSHFADRSVQLNSDHSFDVGTMELAASLNGGLLKLTTDSSDDQVVAALTQSNIYYNSGLRFEKTSDNYFAALGVNALGTVVDFDTDQPGTRRTLAYLSPTVQLEAYPTKGLTVFVRNRPEILANGVASLFRTNAYVVAEPLVQPSLRTIQADVGAGISLEPIQVMLSLGYDQSPNWQYFESTTIADLNGFFQPRYARATAYRATITADVDVTGSLHGTVSASYRQSNLDDFDAEIPYHANWIGSATLGYRFLRRRALIQFESRYTGNRFADTSNMLELDPTVNLGLNILYNVSRSVGITVHGSNLLGNKLEFWDGYPQVDRQIMGGLRLLW